MTKTVNAAYDQDRFAEVVNDAADESATLGTTNANFSKGASETFRVRFTIQQTQADANSALTITPTLFYSYNAGAYTEAGNPTDTDAPVRVVASANVTDNATTTLRLGSGDSNIAGRLEDSAPGATAVTFSNPSNGEATEYEWALEIYSGYSGLANGDTIVLRVYDSTNALDTYTNAPTITVSIPITGAQTEGGTAGHSFSATAALTAARTEGAQAGDTEAAGVTYPVSQTEGATSGHSQTGTVTTPTAGVLYNRFQARHMPRGMPNLLTEAMQDLLTASTSPNITVSETTEIPPPFPGLTVYKFTNTDGQGCTIYKSWNDFPYEGPFTFSVFMHHGNSSATGFSRILLYVPNTATYISGHRFDTILREGFFTVAGQAGSWEVEHYPGGWMRVAIRHDGSLFSAANLDDLRWYPIYSGTEAGVNDFTYIAGAKLELGYGMTRHNLDPGVRISRRDAPEFSPGADTSRYSGRSEPVNIYPFRRPRPAAVFPSPITVVGTENYYHSTGGSSHTFTEPAGIQQNDLVVVAVNARDVSEVHTITDPADFTQIDQWNPGVGSALDTWYLGYKVRGATAGDALTFSLDVADAAGYMMVVLRGVNPNYPFAATWARASHFNAVVNDSNPTPDDIAGITNQFATLLIYGNTQGHSPVTSGAPLNYADVASNVDQTKGLAAFLQTIPGAGTETPTAYRFTETGGINDARTATLALRPLNATIVQAHTEGGTAGDSLAGQEKRRRLGPLTSQQWRPLSGLPNLLTGGEADFSGWFQSGLTITDNPTDCPPPFVGAPIRKVVVANDASCQHGEATAITAKGRSFSFSIFMKITVDTGGGMGRVRIRNDDRGDTICNIVFNAEGQITAWSSGTATVGWTEIWPGGWIRACLFTDLETDATNYFRDGETIFIYAGPVTGTPNNGDTAYYAAPKVEWGRTMTRYPLDTRYHVPRLVRDDFNGSSDRNVLAPRLNVPTWVSRSRLYAHILGQLIAASQTEGATAGHSQVAGVLDLWIGPRFADQWRHFRGMPNLISWSGQDWAGWGLSGAISHSTPNYEIPPPFPGATVRKLTATSTAVANHLEIFTAMGDGPMTYTVYWHHGIGSSLNNVAVRNNTRAVTMFSGRLSTDPLALQPVYDWSTALQDMTAVRVEILPNLWRKVTITISKDTDNDYWRRGDDVQIYVGVSGGTVTSGDTAYMASPKLEHGALGTRHNRDATVHRAIRHVQNTNAAPFFRPAAMPVRWLDVRNEATRFAPLFPWVTGFRRSQIRDPFRTRVPVNTPENWGDFTDASWAKVGNFSLGNQVPGPWPGIRAWRFDCSATGSCFIQKGISPGATALRWEGYPGGNAAISFFIKKGNLASFTFVARDDLGSRGVGLIYNFDNGTVSQVGSYKLAEVIRLPNGWVWVVGNFKYRDTSTWDQGGWNTLVRLWSQGTLTAGDYVFVSEPFIIDAESHALPQPHPLLTSRLALPRRPSWWAHLGDVSVVLASISLGAQASETFANTLQAVASQTEATQSSESFVNALAAVASQTEGGTAGETFANILAMAASQTEGGTAGDALEAIVAILADLTLGAQASDSSSVVAALVAAAEESGTQGVAQAVTAALSAQQTEAVQSGASQAVSRAFSAQLAFNLQAAMSGTATGALISSATLGAISSDDSARFANYAGQFTDGSTQSMTADVIAALVASHVAAAQTSETMTVTMQTSGATTFAATAGATQTGSVTAGLINAYATFAATADDAETVSAALAASAAFAAQSAAVGIAVAALTAAQTEGGSAGLSAIVSTVIDAAASLGATLSVAQTVQALASVAFTQDNLAGVTAAVTAALQASASESASADLVSTAMLTMPAAVTLGSSAGFDSLVERAIFAAAAEGASSGMTADNTAQLAASFIGAAIADAVSQTSAQLTAALTDGQTSAFTVNAIFANKVFRITGTVTVMNGTPVVVAADATPIVTIEDGTPIYVVDRREFEN